MSGDILDDLAAAYDEPRRDADGNPLPPHLSEEALAMRFVERHGAEFRYVAAWGKWFRFDGVRWVAEDTLMTFDRVRTICREASAEAEGKAGYKIASASTVAAVERLAKADRRIAATVDQWDTDVWLLNTPAGTVDLRTGQLRPHAPGDYITRVTAVAPAAGEIDAPIWFRFLDRIFVGSGDLIDFLQRTAGYSLTGSTREHALFFAHGGGGNGKGVAINTLTAILGDYARVAPIETFTASTGDSHPTELAMLRGARLVTAQETEEGRRWAESRIKALTGGDPITARFMRQDFFTFVPQFKLLIAGNHKPGLRAVDEAMRRRFNLIPFGVTIPREERDPDLPEKLRAEWPAILAWAIEGCLTWQRLGLAAPAEVRDATTEYLEDEDAMGLWLAECCKASSQARENTADLFASWKAWAERAGEHPGSQKRFSQGMQARGFEPQRERTGKAGFAGIMLVRRDYTMDPRHAA